MKKAKFFEVLMVLYFLPYNQMDSLCRNIRAFLRLNNYDRMEAAKIDFALNL